MAGRILKLDIRSADFTKPSVIVLILANLIPLYGVIFLGWEAFPVLVLFWMENVVTGIINVIKMLVCSPGNPSQWAAKLFLIPFFCFHYGLFTFVHGIFVLTVFGDFLNSTSSGLFDLHALDSAFRHYNIIWPFLALTISHVFSFAVNYIGKGEYKETTLSALMSQPYARVVVLHITIIAGGFLLMVLGSPIAGLVVLVILKTAIDIVTHLRQHRKQSHGRLPAS